MKINTKKIINFLLILDFGISVCSCGGPKKFTVTWDVEGSKTSETYGYGETPTYKNGTPAKASTAQYSYAFAGWSPEVTPVTGNQTYTATFEETKNKFSVFFRNFDGTLLEETKVDYGTEARYVGPTPTRPDSGHNSYGFKSWDIDLSSITSDVTTFALYYVFDVYVFAFSSGNTETIRVHEGADISTSLPENTKNSCTTNMEISYSWVCDDKYSYHEEPKIREFYFVSYELDGGENSQLNPKKAYSDTKYELYEPFKNGYAFGGWFANSERTNAILSIENIKADLVLFALFTPINYSINYILNGGDNHLKNPSSYTIEDDIVLKNPSKIGYEFDGWYLDHQFTQRISEISNMVGNLCLYAKFSPKLFVAAFRDSLKVTLVAEGFSDLIFFIPYGEKFDPYSVEIMSKYLSADQNTHYAKNDPNFSGWFEDPNYSIRLSNSITPTDDVTLYCHFHFTHIFKNESMFKDSSFARYVNGECYYRRFRVPTLCDGYINIKSMVYSYSYTDHGSHRTELHVSRIDSKGDYTTLENIFLGYDNIMINKTYKVEPGDLIEIVYSGGDNADGISCYAEFKIHGRMSSPIHSSCERKREILYDDIINNFDHHEKIGYSFGGWIDKDGNNVSGQTWKYTENQVFYSTYEAKFYNIHYFLDGGTNSPNNPQTYTIEDTVILSSANKLGYSFDGWYTDSNFSRRVTSISDSVGDINLYAKFVRNSYLINLDSNNGAFAPKIEFFSNDQKIKTVYLHEEETLRSYYPSFREGFLFGGWYTDQNFTRVFNFNATVTKDIKLFAKWIPYSGVSICPDSEPSKNIMVNGKNEELISFVPMADGVITVTSQSDLDLVGSLFDSNKNVLISNDDIDDTNLNFALSYYVRAGEQYFLSVKGSTVSSTGAAVLTFDWFGEVMLSGSTYSRYTTEIFYGDYFRLPDAAERNGYIFLGWFDDEGNKFDFGWYNFTENLNLHAEWETI